MVTQCEPHGRLLGRCLTAMINSRPQENFVRGAQDDMAHFGEDQFRPLVEEFFPSDSSRASAR